MSTKLEQGLQLAVETLFNKKGKNILTLDVSEISTLTDYFIVAEGTVNTQVKALAQALLRAFKTELGETPIHVEGLSEGDWIVIDFMDVIIHIMVPEMREKYHLEPLWKEGKVVNFDDILSEKG